MTDLEYLRLLIHDKEKTAFTDDELTRILQETADSYTVPLVPDPTNPFDGYTLNVYRAAVFCLNIVLSDPRRMQSYNRGGVSWTRAEIRQSIEEYRGRAGDGAKSIRVEKVY